MDNHARCGQCKFWGTKEQNKHQTPLRQCTAIIHDKKGRTTDVEHHLECPEFYEEQEMKEALALLPANLAVAVDGSGWFAAIKTRESFGCVLFEERVENQK